MADAFTGEIRLMPYTYAPEYWLECAGQTMSIQQYTALYAVIGLRYGGDGQTNFRLPDLRGRVAVGTGTGPGFTTYGIGETWGQQIVTLTEVTIPPHTHGLQVSDTTTNLTQNPVGGLPGGQQRLYAPPGSATKVPMGAAVSAVGGRHAHNNMAPYTALRFCICLDGEFPIRP